MLHLSYAYQMLSPNECHYLRYVRQPCIISIMYDSHVISPLFMPGTYYLRYKCQVLSPFCMLSDYLRFVCCQIISVLYVVTSPFLCCHVLPPLCMLSRITSVMNVTTYYLRFVCCHVLPPFCMLSRIISVVAHVLSPLCRVLHPIFVTYYLVTPSPMHVYSPRCISRFISAMYITFYLRHVYRLSPLSILRITSVNIYVLSPLCNFISCCGVCKSNGRKGVSCNQSYS